MTLQATHPLTNFDDFFTDLLRQVETVGSLPFPQAPYYDSVATGKPVTIGHGINVDHENIAHLQVVLHVLGVFTAADQLEANRRSLNQLPHETDFERALRNTFMVQEFQLAFQLHRPVGSVVSADNEELASALRTLLGKYGVAGDFALTEEMSKQAVMHIVDGLTIDGAVDQPSMASELNKRLGGQNAVPRDSREYAALLSMYWNASTTIPRNSSLARAIANGDHSEAWFQIRYRTNKAPATGVVAKRRYYEAQVFGLYNTDALHGFAGPGSKVRRFAQG